MRNKNILFFLQLLFIVPFIFTNTFAQSFTLKIIGQSPGDLNLDYTTAQDWPVSSGLRVVPVGKRVYLSADTTEGVTSYTWSITQKPGGSNAVLDSGNTQGNSFIPDMTGSYTVSATVGTRTLTRDIFVSTFRGLTLTQDCAPCHQGEADKFDEWNKSGHGTMYKRGLTGNLAVSNGSGLYGDYCVKCHTTGWDSTDANGNFGYVAHQTGWDTTWFRPGELTNGTIRIPQNDSSRWERLRNDFETVEPVANIGCESCHGPANDHAMTGNPTLVAVSLEAGACNQCHDAPPGYQVGTSWKLSRHATMPLSGQTTLGRAACFPCHSGAAFVKYTKNKANPGYNAAQDAFPSVSCATCHDPHNDENTGLRTLSLDSLANGYVPTSNPNFRGGAGLLCMNCHHARENSFVKVTNQAKKFSDRFYPHYSPQADMFVGANAYEFGLDNITGIGPHQFLEDGCVTCHMAPKPESEFGETNHEMSMKDEQGNERVYVCQTCHSEAQNSFDDVKANSDYDGDGTIEGGQSEIQGLMDQLKAILPKDKNGEVVTMAIDSLVVKNDPNYPRNLPAIFNYNFVSHDFSFGVHNPPYAAAILQASLNNLTGVKQVDNVVPKTYTLEQNFPNPFNPATRISFSIPEATVVTLKVYDALGNEIATLHRGFLNAGNYKFDWNAGNLSSGVYYYKLSSDKFSQTKKMILLK